MGTIEKIVKRVTEFKAELENMPVNREAEAVSREEFTLLLSGISTCRKAPGISEHMGYEKLYHCKSREEANETREHLQRLFGIHDEESFLEACGSEYSGSDQYEQFMTFWAGAPLFDMSELSPDGNSERQRTGGRKNSDRPAIVCKPGMESGRRGWGRDKEIPPVLELAEAGA